MQFARRFYLLGLLLACPLLLTACGNPTAYKVTGKVLYENKPATGAVVTFHKAQNDDKKILPNGVVGEDGSFELTTFALDDGVPAGDYKVVIYWERKPAKKTGNGDDDEAIGQILPARYLKPETSGLDVTITKTTTTLKPFLLTK